VSGVAERYAGALFDVALEAGALDTVAADLDAFAALLAESADLRRLVESPIYGVDDQTRAMSAVLARAGVSGYAANFLLLAARNRRLFAAAAMIRAYRARLAAHRGEVAVSVVSAAPLADAELAGLKAALADGGARTIALATRVDPSLIAGLVVRMGSRSLDTSLKTKLATLKVALKEVR
jgi:F-type H+-transporting ATPase subunit delta